MKLIIYEHCPFCARVRTIFGLKRLPVDISVLMEGDAETPMRLVGRKVVPILIKDDGTAMAESMDIVRYVDSAYGPRVLTAPPRAAIDAWCQEGRALFPKLVIPRKTRSAFRENSTPAAQAAYCAREERAIGNLEAHLANTPHMLPPAQAHLNSLEPLMEDWPTRSESDLVLYSTLRSLSIVRGLTMPPRALEFARAMERSSGVELLCDRAI